MVATKRRFHATLDEVESSTQLPHLAVSDKASATNEASNEDDTGIDNNDPSSQLVRMCVRVLRNIRPKGMTTKDLSSALDAEKAHEPGFKSISSSVLSSKLNALFRRYHSSAKENTVPSDAELTDLPLTRRQSEDPPKRLVYVYTPPNEADSDDSSQSESGSPSDKESATIDTNNLDLNPGDESDKSVDEPLTPEANDYENIPNDITVHLKNGKSEKSVEPSPKRHKSQQIEETEDAVVEISPEDDDHADESLHKVKSSDDQDRQEPDESKSIEKSVDPVEPIEAKESAESTGSTESVDQADTKEDSAEPVDAVKPAEPAKSVQTLESEHKSNASRPETTKPTGAPATPEYSPVEPHVSKSSLAMPTNKSPHKAEPVAESTSTPIVSKKKLDNRPKVNLYYDSIGSDTLASAFAPTASSYQFQDKTETDSFDFDFESIGEYESPEHLGLNELDSLVC